MILWVQEAFRVFHEIARLAETPSEDIAVSIVDEADYWLSYLLGKLNAML